MVNEENKRIMITLPIELVKILDDMCKEGKCTRSEFIEASLNTLIKAGMSSLEKRLERNRKFN